jgi:hypothetical protein
MKFYIRIQNGLSKLMKMYYHNAQFVIWIHKNDILIGALLFASTGIMDVSFKWINSMANRFKVVLKTCS